MRSMCRETVGSISDCRRRFVTRRKTGKGEVGEVTDAEGGSITAAAEEERSSVRRVRIGGEVVRVDEVIPECANHRDSRGFRHTNNAKEWGYDCSCAT